MKGMKKLIGFLLIPCLAGCGTIPGDFSIKSSNSESEIYVDGRYEGKGSVHLTTLDEDLDVRIETTDHDDLTVEIFPDYIKDKNRSGMQASESLMLAGFLLGALWFIPGAIVAGLKPDEDAPNYETYTREVGPMGSIFMSIGVVFGAGGVLGIINSHKEKPIWESRYSYDVHPLAHYDDQGFHKETGFNKFGVNRQGVFVDGSRFIGHIDRGEKTGYGTLINPEGDKYTGNFVNDVLAGFGVSRMVDGSGRNGLADGRGDAVTKDCQVRIVGGQFSRGRLIEGTMLFQDGTVYEGRFDGDLLLEGMITKKDGQVYEGSLRNGIPSGQGKLRKPDGSEYTGNFENGMPRGEGELTFPNGDSYRGPFAGGLPHGEGMYRFRSGDVERCEYFEGKRVDPLYKMRLENARAEEQRRQDQRAAEEQRRRDLEEEAERREAEARRREREEQPVKVERNEWAVNALAGIDKVGNRMIEEAKSSATVSSGFRKDDADYRDSGSYERSDSTSGYKRRELPEAPQVSRSDYSFEAPSVPPKRQCQTVTVTLEVKINTGLGFLGQFAVASTEDRAIEKARKGAKEALFYRLDSDQSWLPGEDWEDIRYYDLKTKSRTLEDGSVQWCAGVRATWTGDVIQGDGKAANVQSN